MKWWFLNWEPFQKPEFSPTTRTWLGNALHDGVRRYSMIIIVGLALTAAVLPGSALFGFKPDRAPALPARGDAETQGKMMRIDGNLALESVAFDHEEHKDLAGGEQGCVKCHHMNFPEAVGTPCSGCHTDMYAPRSAFDHEAHQAEFGDNQGCVECHPADKDPMNARSCVSCHQEMYPDKGDNERVNYQAPSYVDAMHGACVECHEDEAQKQSKPMLGQCAGCHPHPAAK
jgi:hypothetical protein